MSIQQPTLPTSELPDSTPQQVILPYSMWDLIRSDFEREFGPMPSPTKCQIIVDVVDNRITGFFAMQHCVHAGPEYVYPEARNQGVGERMARAMDSLFKGKDVTVFIVTDNPRIKELALELGLVEAPGVIYGKVID